MAEEKRVSDVWKDGGNTDGKTTVDLKAHLQKLNANAQVADGKAKLFQHLASFLSNHPSHAPLRILDLGCGLGQDMHTLGSQLTPLTGELHLTGVDFNTTMVKQATELAPEISKALTTTITSVKVDVVQHDVTLADLPFPANTFDVVYFCFTIQHISKEHVAKVQADLVRVLKPGGYIGFLEAETSFTRIYTSDDKLKELMHKNEALAASANRSMDIGSYLAHLRKENGLNREFVEYVAFTNDDMEKGDPGYVKTKAMMDFMVKANKIEAAVADELFQRTKTANDSKDLIRVSFAMVAVFSKPK